MKTITSPKLSFSVGSQNSLMYVLMSGCYCR